MIEFLKYRSLPLCCVRDMGRDSPQPHSQQNARETIPLLFPHLLFPGGGEGIYRELLQMVTEHFHSLKLWR